jgi:hypothetical protein
MSQGNIHIAKVGNFTSTLYDPLKRNAVPAGVVKVQFLQMFKDYPPSQADGSFSIDLFIKELNGSLNTKSH